MNKKINEKTKRILKFGGISTLTTVLFVVAAVIINIIVTSLNDAYPLSLDLTPNSFYSLNDETKEFIKSINDRIEITVLGTRDDAAAGQYSASQGVYDFTSSTSYMNGMVEDIENMGKASENITVSYVDIVLNPSFVSQYPSEALVEGSVIVKCGDKYRMLDYSDLFTVDITSTEDEYVYYVAASNVEQAVCSAITNVTSEDQKIVTVVSGHGEGDSSALITLLQTNNFDVRTVDMTLQDIDNGSSFLIINTPNRDYSAEEIEKLEAYLENGGQYNKNIMVFYDSGQPEVANLNAFLEKWGLSAGSDLVYETDASKVYSEGIFFRADYDSDTFAEEVAESGGYVAMLGARPVDILFEERDGIKTISLLGVSNSAVIKPLSAATTWSPGESAEKGPFSVLALSEKDLYNDPYMTSRVFLCGTNYAVAASIINNPAFSNYEYFASVFNAVTDNDVSLSIPTKTVSEKSVNMTSSQVNVIGFVIFTVIVPLLMIICGVVIFIRRKTL